MRKYIYKKNRICSVWCYRLLQPFTEVIEYMPMDRGAKKEFRHITHTHTHTPLQDYLIVFKLFIYANLEEHFYSTGSIIHIY